MQENWIGKSVGLQFSFKLDQSVAGIDALEVFSTRPDTIFGASFAAIAADHPIALALAEKDANLAAFAEECRHSGTAAARSEEHTSELQSLMRISYAVFCLKKKTKNKKNNSAKTNQN